MNKTWLWWITALACIGILTLPSGGQEGEGTEAPAQSTSVSPHGELSLPCSACHTTEGWLPIAEQPDFDHSTTGFPLVAGHRKVACMDCHGDPRFAWVASACADCHRDPHQGELNLGCSDCHDPRGWQGAARELRERHAATLFPLTGAHADLDCASCHAGVSPTEFSTTPSDCFSCHRADYLAARDPNHVAAGFPTACETCHGTDSWRPADFRSHDNLFFPIFAGPHRGVWNACSDCHISPSTFAVFSCFACHSRPDMAEEHDDVAGYVYESNACFACHPRGRE